MRDDYYDLLGVSPEADRRAVKAAYRRLAMQLHPDHNDNNPAAAEKFKLVAEAWHTLSDTERRANYDGWLERRRKYDRLPELAEMPRHHARMSTRNANRRNERRSARHASNQRTRVRPFLLRRSTRVPGWQYVLMCAMCLCCIIPGITRASRGIGRSSESSTPSGLRPGESPLSPEEQRKSLQQYLERISSAAQKGDPAAQFAYANLLYNGIAGLGMHPNPTAAHEWWLKAARQGHKLARRALDAMSAHHSAAEDRAESSAPGGS